MATPEPADAGVEHAAAVDFEYDTERRARAVAESIAVEVDEIDDARSGADVDRDGRVVRVDVAAADLVALRAGLNTWLRLVTVAEEVVGLGEQSVSSSVHTDATAEPPRNDSRDDESPTDDPPRNDSRDDESPTDDPPRNDPPDTDPPSDDPAGTGDSGRDTPERQ
jgi:KEOPS complex subunit Pcc1